MLVLEDKLAALEAEARRDGYLINAVARRLPICIHTTSERPVRGGKLVYFTVEHRPITREEAIKRLAQQAQS